MKSADEELMLVEVQNESQVDYFQRMIYGASKLITEYIKEGEPYSTIKKVYSINIVYFGLGQGTDYVYEYDGKFIGIHNGDILQPTLTQEGFKAKGLQEASEKLKEDTLSKEERIAYKRFQENRRIERSEIETALKEGEEKGIEKGIEKGMEQKEVEFVLNLHSNGFQAEEIAKLTNLTVQRVKAIIQ